MNLLDENIPKDQRLLLESWGIRVRKIGVNVLQRGTDDRGIIPFLQQHRCTFFTRDEDFFNRKLCHPKYCIVLLSVGEDADAAFVRHLLKHSQFNTETKRLGKVVRLSNYGISMWVLHSPRLVQIGWE